MALSRRCISSRLLCLLFLATTKVLWARHPAQLSEVQDGTDYVWPVSHEETLRPLPEHHSKCHPDILTKKYAIVVAGKNFHNITWLEQLSDDVEIVLYQTVNSEEAHYFTGFGHEAQAYLRFIVDYYDCMPEAIAFIHGHLESWHSKPMLETLQSFQWKAIPGYTDLNRMMPIWSQHMQRAPDFPGEVAAMGKDAYNGTYEATQIFEGVAYDHFTVGDYMLNKWLRHAYDVFFGHMLKIALPYKIEFICCSQFAVTRERILARDLMFWRLNLHYLFNNDIMATTRFSKTYIVGDIFSYLWPLLLGEPAKYERRVADEELFKNSSHGA